MNWNKISFWLCVGGSIIFILFTLYFLFYYPLMAALIGIGYLGGGMCLRTWEGILDYYEKKEREKHPDLFV